MLTFRASCFENRPAAIARAYPFFPPHCSILLDCKDCRTIANGAKAVESCEVPASRDSVQQWFFLAVIPPADSERRVIPPDAAAVLAFELCISTRRVSISPE